MSSGVHGAVEVIVIGGGQAGLAAGYHLARRGISYLILDAHSRTGDSWRTRWEGLRLFSPQRYNKLPGSIGQGDPLHLPDRLELADYLEDYAQDRALNVANEQTVETVAITAAGFTVTTATDEYRCNQVIVATGAYRTPRIPQQLDATLPTTLPRLHASDVRDMESVVDATTSLLVVGAGASGQQLARLALAAGAEVVLAGPDIANLPRSVLGKDIYWWLYRSGLMSIRCDKPPGRWFAEDAQGTVTVAEDTASLLAHPRLKRFTTHVDRYANGQLHFTGGATLSWPGSKVGAVLYCTGYRNRYPFLPEEALADDGTPAQRGGISSKLAGLYYLGLPNIRHLNSSLVGGVGRDASQIVAALTGHREAQLR